MGGEEVQEEVFGELLHGEHVHKKRVPLQSLQREGAQDCVGGEDGGGEDDDVRVLLTEVVRVSGRTREALRRGKIVRVCTFRSVDFGNGEGKR